MAMTATAEVTLPQFFTDSMVVQQNSVLTIPGKTKKNATVKITPSWDNQTVKIKAGKDGKFTAKLNTPGYGGPYTLTIDDGTKKTLKDILVGDVWFCSGQSNMEMPVAGWGKVMDYRREVAKANYPNVRLLQIQKQTSYSPQADTKINMGGWRSATPETVANFSSIGYFFGRDLNQETGIPVGVIDCTWGGTPIEAWMSYETLGGINEFADELAAIKASNFDSETLLQTYKQRYNDWVELTMKDDLKFDTGKLQRGWGTLNTPALWEDSELPNFDGVVWMQKEVNLPATVEGQSGVLHLSTIDDDDVTYINGVKVGQTVGYNLPRVYTVPAGVLRPGSNVITVRVADYQGGGGLWGDAADMYLMAGDEKTPVDGKWNYKVGVDISQLPAMPISPVNSSFPTVLYNAMMHPLTIMPVKGVLWYQGCANVGNEQFYTKAFKAMINAWRKEWGNEQLPFYFVQLAGYLQPKRFQPQSQWAALRQAQKDALQLPNTGMCVAIDLGNPDDIHPKNKQAVAKRLLNIALHNLYGYDKQVCDGPEIVKTSVNGNNMRIVFDQPVTMYGGGNAFVVKGSDGKWAVGYGRQIADQIIEVSSDEIDNPVEVRYDWADCPDGNLRGLTGLPVSPFAVGKSK